MKKLITLSICAALALLLAGCTKVEPTNLDYKYVETVRGTVKYSNGNPASGITVNMTATGALHYSYKATSQENGQYSFTLPCLSADEVSFSLSVNCVKDGYRYRSDGSYNYNSTPGGEDSKVDITLKDGVKED